MKVKFRAIALGIFTSALVSIFFGIILGISDAGLEENIYNLLGFKLSSIIAPLVTGILSGYVTYKYSPKKTKYQNTFFLGVVFFIIDIIFNFLLPFFPRLQIFVFSLNAGLYPDPEWLLLSETICIVPIALFGGWIRSLSKNEKSIA